MIEIEVGTRIDDREVHAGVPGIERDPVNLRDSVIAFCAGLYRFHVDDPVADHLTGASEVRVWELVNGPRAVVITRVFAVEENAPSHHRSRSTGTSQCHTRRRS